MLAPMTNDAPDAPPSPRRPSSRHDETFWAAVRATYASGVTAERTAKLFGIGASTLMREAKAGGWLRKDLARQSDAALAAVIAGGAGLGPERRSTLEDGVVPTVIVAARAALMQASEAALHGETADADASSRLGDRLFKTAKDLGWSPAAELRPPPAEHIDAEADCDALLAQIETALERGRVGLRLEVAALEAQGLDPRRGWFWDADAGDWVWNAAQAFAEEADAHRASALYDDAREEPRTSPGFAGGHPGLDGEL